MLSVFLLKSPLPCRPQKGHFLRSLPTAQHLVALFHRSLPPRGRECHAECMHRVSLTVNSQLSTLNCQLSIVNSQLSTVNSQLSTVNSPLPLLLTFLPPLTYPSDNLQDGEAPRLRSPHRRRVGSFLHHLPTCYIEP